MQHIDAKIAADPQKKEYERKPVSVLMETIKLTVISTSMRAGPLAQWMRLISATKGQRVMITLFSGENSDANNRSFHRAEQTCTGHG